MLLKQLINRSYAKENLSTEQETRQKETWLYKSHGNR